MEDMNDVQNQVVADEQTDEIEVVEEQAPKKQRQSSQDNAIAKAARLEAEKRQREAEQKYQEVLKKIGVTRIEDLDVISYDLTDAERKKYTDEAEDKGLDVEDYLERKELMKILKAQKAESAAKQAKKVLDEESKKLAERDIEDFKDSYPDVDPDVLMKDERFKEFSEDKLGRKTFLEVYESYKRVTGMKDDEIAARAEQRATRSTGSTNRGSEKVVLTRTQYQELERWNEEHPDMKMTAKEFLDY